MSNTKPVVEVKDLHKTYTSFWSRITKRNVNALNGISFDIQPGEIFGLLGPNGSGKTTTIKILLGLISSTKGTVSIFDKAPNNLKVKNKIGYLPEESYFYNFLSGEETLLFFGNLFNIPKTELRVRVEKLLKMVGMYDARKRPLKQYSKGMMRRIGLAQALINEPELLLLDEPTTGLDPVGIKEMKTLIRQLKNEGIAVLLCSHLLAHVEDLCDRVIILHQGQMKKIGNLKTLLSKSDVTNLVLRNINENTLNKVLENIREQGGEIVSCGSGHDKLEDYFINLVKEEAAGEKDPGNIQSDS